MGKYGKIRSTGPIYRLAYAVLTPYMRPFVRLHVEGEENLPEGGTILVSNHLSNVDPLNVGYVFGIRGREVHFMAKAELFRVPLLGRLLRAWGMIPVDRKSSAAARSLVYAQRAIDDGQTICVFFEGTITRDPAYWPMKGKTGAARLALDTRAPLVPMVQWGTQNIMERYSARLRLKKTDVYVRVLPQVDLSDIDADSSDHDAVHEVSRRLQVAMTEGLAAVRDEAVAGTPIEAKTGPNKKELARLSKWRRQLSKAARQQEILSK